jgi:DNA-binding NtrC family response regulator/predicted hydrocarbon binding protein
MINKNFDSFEISSSLQEGLIFLGNQRMLLVDVARMGFLRQELVATLGMDRAKNVLLRMGYSSGVRDYEWMKKILPESDAQELMRLGPELHNVRGGAHHALQDLKLNVKEGIFYLEGIWENSYEVDIHKELFGIHSEHVCWEAVGYATGFCTALMGKPIYFREVFCRGKGDSSCRIVGKPVDEWGDIEDELSFFRADSVIEEILDLQSNLTKLRETVKGPYLSADIVGNSEELMNSVGLLEQVSNTSITVLLLGETGVGKECFANYLHQKGSHSSGQFIAVNCGAIPDELIEAELFGVEKGAFTGANTTRIGRFERAVGGTLFLDEVGELSLSAQTKLLRVLQDGMFERLGGSKTLRTDARIVAATNVDLAKAVETGKFRKDLFYRLNLYPIEIPPLRNRLGDIKLLVEHFVHVFAVKHAKKIAGIKSDVMELLTSYPWPGNVRELQNIIERGVILASYNGYIEAKHLSFSPISPSKVTSGDLEIATRLEQEIQEDFSTLLDQMLQKKTSLEDLQNSLILSAVNRAGGNLSDAAKLLGMSRSQVSYSLKKAKHLSN